MSATQNAAGPDLDLDENAPGLYADGDLLAQQRRESGDLDDSSDAVEDGAKPFKNMQGGR